MLTEYVRNALRRTICSTYVESGEDGRSRLYCVTMDPAVEDLINGYVERGPTGTTLSIPPPMAKRIANAVSRAAQSLLTAGHQLLVLTAPSVRGPLKQILDAQLSGAVVLSYNEIVRGLDVESMGLVQFESESPKTPAEPAPLVGSGVGSG